MKPFTKKFLTFILKTEARLVIWKYKPKIITITGSQGKTSAKDAIYAVLSQFTHVRKSEKSYNSEFGLPLTVLGLPNAWNNPLGWAENFGRGLWLFLYPHKYPKWLVLEVGIGKPGDMGRTAGWVPSDVVLETGIGWTPAHIEFFEGREHVIREKSQLINTLKPEGLLILNHDDEAALGMKSLTRARVVTYGFDSKADVLASGYNISYDGESARPTGISFRVDIDGKSLPVVIDGVFGQNHMYAALSALAFAVGMKYNLVTAIEALKVYDVAPGRMRMLLGLHDTLIIDDTYNSSPFACVAALRTLAEVKATRKVAILGDMLELGKHTVEAHQSVGKVVAENVDVLVVVGLRAQSIKEGALEAGMAADKIQEFKTSWEAGEFVRTMLSLEDLILVKGSQGMRMERVVGEILLDQTNKASLLVRQEEEWLKRE